LDNSFWFSCLQDFVVSWVRLHCYPSWYNSINMNSNHVVQWMLPTPVVPCVRNIETQILVCYLWSKHKQTVSHARLHGHTSPIKFACSFIKIYQLFGTFWHCRIYLSCNNVAPVTNLCLGKATTRSHSSQWSSWNIKTHYLRFKHFIITITDDPSPC
jgi:hypothetical protein